MAEFQQARINGRDAFERGLLYSAEEVQRLFPGIPFTSTLPCPERTPMELILFHSGHTVEKVPMNWQFPDPWPKYPGELPVEQNYYRLYFTRFDGGESFRRRLKDGWEPVPISLLLTAFRLRTKEHGHADFSWGGCTNSYYIAADPAPNSQDVIGIGAWGGYIHLYTIKKRGEVFNPEGWRQEWIRGRALMKKVD